MKKAILKRTISAIICMVMLLSSISVFSFSAVPAGLNNDAVTDICTAGSYKGMMGTDIDGNRYSGRLWADKSVYKNGDKIDFNADGTDDITVALEEDEQFQVIFSLLGSSMTTTSKTVSSGPMDVVVILDNSTSMDDVNGGTTRLEKVITATNSLVANLLKAPDIRIGVTSYNNDADTVVPFGRYTNGIVFSVDKYYFDEYAQNKGGTITARDNSGAFIGADNGYARGTNTQSGYDLAMRMLQSAQNTDGRTPIVILLTDGAANTAVDKNFYDITKGTNRQRFYDGGVPVGVALSTLLNGAYMKASVEDNYGKAPYIYGIGVDLENGDGSDAIINPKAAFNSSNTNANIKDAYNHFVNTWSKGRNVKISHSGYSFEFDHNYPAGSQVTDQDVIANINYVDQYYNVKSEQIDSTFTQIYEELSSVAFNPITTQQSSAGATGEENTPLIYVDDIGKYMEVKEIEAVTLFGQSYNVIKNSNGTYSVALGTGTNPTTNEDYNTTRDINIFLTTNPYGTQRLQVEINQQILPILVERIATNTVGKVTTSTIAELLQEPLRIFYTIGIDSDIILPNGDIDITKIDPNYSYIDNANGKIKFFSNNFGSTNKIDSDSNGHVDLGDAHIGFKPSKKNRYYYHQSNQGIFTNIQPKGTNQLQWDQAEYGVLWDDSAYELTWMSYNEYLNAQDDDTVYTYVTYFRPTPDTTDAATAAEEVTYLIYADWKYLKESVAFYDNKTEKYVNYDSANDKFTLDDEGYVVSSSKIAEYVAANPSAELYAVLGIGSNRSSRLHNMSVAKTVNATGTADHRYVPEYTYETSSNHHGNEVVVWLGNNGSITADIDTGIALTKNVTEAIGRSSDSYELTVSLRSNKNCTPVVKDQNGTDITATHSDYTNGVLTVNVRANETVYISGIPAGTVCDIGENVKGDYYISSKTDSVTVPSLTEVAGGTPQFVPANVTNTPHKYGNLYITKEISSDHDIPTGIINQNFKIEVDLGEQNKLTDFSVKYADRTDAVSTDENGILNLNVTAAHTVEILDIPMGTEVTVTERLTSEQADLFVASYRTRDYSTATADSDNKVTITANTNSTAVVMNKYTPKPTTLDLDVVIKKNLIAPSNVSAMPFFFEIHKKDGDSWNKLYQKNIIITYLPNGANKTTVSNILSGEPYDKVGTYAYRIVEKKMSTPNITYDRTEYHFNVIVTDVEGQLVAKAYDHNNVEMTSANYSGEFVFTNTYNTAPVSINIVKDTGDTGPKENFKITAIPTDANGTEIPGSTPISVNTDATGNAVIATTFSSPDKYYYKIVEENDGRPGWTYSKAEYYVTVDVTADNNGKLSAVLSINSKNTATGEQASVGTDKSKATVTFTNKYTPTPVNVSIDNKVTKQLNGDKNLAGNDFTFVVYENGTQNEIIRGTNDINGNVTFNKPLSFTKAGKYEFDVKELKGSIAGITYDKTVYDLVVEVTDNKTTGSLEANWYFEDAVTDTVTFVNYYTTTPTEYILGGKKELTGRALRAGEFEFSLYEGQKLIETVKNKADGTFTFTKINYDKAGIYNYRIVEKDGNEKGVTYTGALSPIDVTVTVTDTNAVLSATASIKNSEIVFENSYSPESAYVTFNATKQLTGRTLSDKEFSFSLYATDNTFAIPAGVTPKTAQNDTYGNISFEKEKFDKAGIYFYTMIENVGTADDIVYDKTQHNFMVYVSDDSHGNLRARAVHINSASEMSGTDIMAPKPAFVNATTDVVTKKEVYLDNSSTEIDGKKVSEGEILTYFISYTNYTGHDVEVDIMDVIPEHTSYVDGSASHGGTFAGGHINWILDLKRGEQVTVNFKVKVDKTQKIIANTATVRDGENLYYTNEVVNHTIDSNLTKDVVSPADTSISIDGKKVYAGDELIYKVSYTNISGAEVDVTITDVIPENTSYIEGSASHGGKFERGAIEWKVEKVAPWETVTVSFKVKVDENVGAVTIKNQANATDSTGNLVSNEVTNYTVVDEAQKDVFAESYPTVSIDGKLVKAGDTLVYTISYTNTADESVVVAITDKIPQGTAYVDGSASNGGIFENGEIKWNITVAAKDSATVTFKVTVDGTEKVFKNTATAVDYKNSYSTNEVTNHIIDNEFVKDVFFEQDMAVSIDGKKVYAGDTLVYTVGYTNITGDETDVTITDVIPENTTYVEGSASNSGKFESGAIEWKFEKVAPWETVTVSFKVKVNDNVGAVTIKNQAKATDSTGNIISNEVTNYTVDDKVQKDVFTESDATVSIDGKTVKAGDTLVYTITYTNTDKQNVTVTITDKIPQGTTYVEGSADNSGTHQNGIVTWTVTVEGVKSATVSFKVTVNAVEKETEILNTADVVEGKNSYTTNTVKNTVTVPEPEENKPEENKPEENKPEENKPEENKPEDTTPDSTTPEDTTPEDTTPEDTTPDNSTPPVTSPNTGDNTNIALWFILLFISGGAIIITAVYSKKKE